MFLDKLQENPIEIVTFTESNKMKKEINFVKLEQKNFEKALGSAIHFTYRILWVVPINSKY